VVELGNEEEERNSITLIHSAFMVLITLRVCVLAFSPCGEQCLHFLSREIDFPLLVCLISTYQLAHSGSIALAFATG
jgi:hypothetical protein